MGPIKGTYVGCDTCGKSFVDFGTNSGDSGFSHFLKTVFNVGNYFIVVDKEDDRFVTNLILADLSPTR